MGACASSEEHVQGTQSKQTSRKGSSPKKAKGKGNGNAMPEAFLIRMSGGKVVTRRLSLAETQQVEQCLSTLNTDCLNDNTALNENTVLNENTAVKLEGHPLADKGLVIKADALKGNKACAAELLEASHESDSCATLRGEGEVVMGGSILRAPGKTSSAKKAEGGVHFYEQTG